MFLSETLEVRTHTASRWVREITAVKARAKNGWDWTGPWLRSSTVVDLPPGALVADCSDVGTKDKPRDRVRLCILTPTGNWHTLGEAEGYEWSLALRDAAREWLALDPEVRAREAARVSHEKWAAIAEKRRDRYAHALSILKEFCEPDLSGIFQVEIPQAYRNGMQHLGSFMLPQQQTYLRELLMREVETIQKAFQEAETEAAALATFLL